MNQPSRIVWLDYLRGFITVLVVAHHSSLAYTTFASFNKQAYILSTHPIVDAARWKGLDIFENFNDVFFMSLMFFISGIFVLPGLQRKGPGAFLRDRFYRLFVPFAMGVTFLMPLAYYPAWLVAHSGLGDHGGHDITAYLVDFFTTEAWPVGPPWFIWVLFFFNGLVVIAYAIKRISAKLQSRAPRKLLLWGYVLTWCVYLPPMLAAGPDAWTGFGPFDFQISRLLLYFSYFLAGMLIGVPRPGKSGFWGVGALLVYTILTLSGPPIRHLLDENQLTHLQAALIYRSIWVFSCTVSCIAFMVVFQRAFRKPQRLWDSLSANAYGIYLLHYIFVVWCQYMLLPVPLPALVKFLITFVLSLLLSWWATRQVRRIPIIKKYL